MGNEPATGPGAALWLVEGLLEALVVVPVLPVVLVLPPPVVSEARFGSVEKDTVMDELVHVAWLDEAAPATKLTAAH